MKMIADTKTSKKQLPSMMRILSMRSLRSISLISTFIFTDNDVPCVFLRPRMYPSVSPLVLVRNSMYEVFMVRQVSLTFQMLPTGSAFYFVSVSREPSSSHMSI